MKDYSTATAPVMPGDNRVVLHQALVCKNKSNELFPAGLQWNCCSNSGDGDNEEALSYMPGKLYKRQNLWNPQVYSLRPSAALHCGLLKPCKNVRLHK